MDAQEIFDTTVLGLRKQGALAKKDGGLCLYFDERTGNRCAVGIHLTPEEYGQIVRYENNMIMDIPTERLPERLRPHIDLLCDLQDAHDKSEDVDGFLEGAREVAESFGVSDASTRQSLLPDAS